MAGTGADRRRAGLLYGAREDWQHLSALVGRLQEVARVLAREDPTLATVGWVERELLELDRRIGQRIERVVERQMRGR